MLIKIQTEVLLISKLQALQNLPRVLGNVSAKTLIDNKLGLKTTPDIRITTTSEKMLQLIFRCLLDLEHSEDQIPIEYTNNFNSFLVFLDLGIPSDSSQIEMFTPNRLVHNTLGLTH